MNQDTKEPMELLSESGLGCISIIVPTHLRSPERIQDTKIIRPLRRLKN
jgi:hypothetical protein